ATMMDSFRPTEEMDCDQRAVFFSPASFSGNDEIARGSVDAVRGDVDGANTDVFTARFDVLRRIGEGEFASVYSVRSVADGRAYAVKRARRAFAGRLERARRLREAELLWAVAPHAAVVRLHAAWEQRGVLHLQLELCAHGSLAAWLDARAAAGDERPCERVAWAVLAHAAEGLAAVHARGVAHFDVKPANFLLTAHFGDIKNNASAWLKLADFGHAVRLPPPRDAWVDVVVREYLAPEMLGGVYSAAADVFSLGMMMLEIVADVVLPANGPDWHSLRAGCFDDPAFARLPYSPLLVDTIKRMLRADPARRPPLASVIATARAQIAEDDDIDDEDDFTAAPAPTARRLAPPSQLLLARANTSFHSATSDHLAAAPLRPASAGPGLARRTASAPGAAAAFPASSAASASAS
ncbi:mitosis inhibitor protein kinase swe1, partial [Coemansia sp. RSA 25]